MGVWPIPSECCVLSVEAVVYGAGWIHYLHVMRGDAARVCVAVPGRI